MKVPIVANILKANDSIAQQNHEALRAKKIFAVNIMSSPGAGKTTLIERTINTLKGELKIGVIEGDIQSTHDSEIIAKTGAQVVQINTGGACHLDANMVSKAIEQLDLSSIDILLIENVGNLVCPSNFWLGEDKKVVLTSVPEGDDKPLKYPSIFLVSDAVIINKIDLLPYMTYDIDKVRQECLRIKPEIKIFQLSSKTGERFDEWIEWLKELRKEKLQG